MSNRLSITPDQTAYPHMLRNMAKKPTIYGIGHLDLLNMPKVAIIGTRRPTPYGITCAELAGSTLADLEIANITSAALGCSIAAARATIQSNGTIIALAANGPDINYPESSKDAFNFARYNSLIISTYTWGTTPLPAYFIHRNDIMAHLADAIIICEAGIPSGVMTIAEKALSLDKPVFAFPGPIFAHSASGPNQLIANGAQIITSEADLRDKLTNLFNLTIQEKQLKHPYPIGEPDSIMATLLVQPMNPTNLAKTLDEPIQDILKHLAKLEVEGKITRLPDGTYSLTVETYQNR